MWHNHPETQEFEVFLGNFTVEGAKKIGWKSKRAGRKAYYTDGTPYPEQAKHGILPYFADKQELFDAGVSV